MADWLVIENSKSPISIDKDWYVLFKNDKFILYQNKNNSKNYYRKDDNTFIYLSGYLIPRLDSGKIQMLDKILNDYIENGELFLKNYKGDFVLIIVHNDKLILFSDYFGVSKFFYSEVTGDFIASNNLKIVSQLRKISLNERNIYLYYLLNYLPFETTFFKELNKNVGGQYIVVDSKGVSKQKYFDVITFLRNRQPLKLKEKDLFQLASNQWMRLIRQYLNHVANERVAITLTAGLDSRLILAAMRKMGVNPVTFTFGRPDSMDVVHAKRISKVLKLEHHHFFPDKDFFDNFSDQALKTVKDGEGLVTQYRAHRYFAYQKVAELYVDHVFFGFIGSEVIRGIHPDGLIFPFFFIDQWLGKETSIQEYLRKSIEEIKPDVLLDVMTYININFKNWEPDQHIFDFLIPLHFSQDMNLVFKQNMQPYAPYWDIDYLEFQKNTPFFININDKRKHSTLGHFKRIMGPKYSAQMLAIIDPENAGLSLGKGYSPNDFVKSRYIAGLKYYLNKKFTSNLKVPNFSYDSWFKNYLLNSVEGMKGYKDIIKFSDNDRNFNDGYAELIFLSTVKKINIAILIDFLNIE